MTGHYDKKLNRWEVTNGHITVRGPEREGCEERLLELERRLKEAQEEHFAEVLRKFEKEQTQW